MALLIFDLDGTLTDSIGDLASAVNHTRSMRGLEPLSLELLTSYVGDGMRKLIQRSVPELSAEEEVNEALRDMMEYYGKHYCEKTTLYPGVRETLEVLAAEHKLALASNKPVEFCKGILEGLGVGRLFSAVVGGGSCAFLKPSAEPLYKAAELAGVTLDDAWMIGDHKTDMASARAAGIKACFCTYGLGEMGKERADAYISDIRLLPAILKDL